MTRVALRLPKGLSTDHDGIRPLMNKLLKGKLEDRVMGNLTLSKLLKGKLDE